MLYRITLDTNPEDCNLHCIMCEEHSQYSDFISKLGRKRRMPEEWLEKIFSEAEKLGVQEIIPSTMGEPLLYRHIHKIFQLCRKYDVRLNLTTNGTFPEIRGMNLKKWAEEIVPICSDIKISWNGVCSETAESVMKGLDYLKAVENLKKFINIRDNHYNLSGHRCRITLQTTFLKSNMKELEDMIRFAASVGADRVKGHHLWAHFPEIENLSFRTDNESAEKWNEIVERSQKLCEDIYRNEGKRVILENIIPLRQGGKTDVPDEYECPFLGKELWISADGKISPCCAPDEKRDTLGYFGNINEVSLKDVLLSKEYADLKENYRSRNLCRVCTMRKPV